jgi:hypothetical protein
MIVSYDEKDTAFFVNILIRQEDDYRNLLTKPQLKLYLDKLADFEKNNPQQNDAYSSLFFSEKLLKEYKFNYKEKNSELIFEFLWFYFKNVFKEFIKSCC